MDGTLVKDVRLFSFAKEFGLRNVFSHSFDGNWFILRLVALIEFLLEWKAIQIFISLMYFGEKFFTHNLNIWLIQPEYGIV